MELEKDIHSEGAMCFDIAHFVEKIVVLKNTELVNYVQTLRN